MHSINNLLTYWQYDENSVAFKDLLDALLVKKCYCLSEIKGKKYIDSRVESVYFFENLDYFKNAKIETELDSTVLELIKPYEHRCLQIINRWRKSFLPSDSFKSVEEIFYILLRYWNNFIKQNRITILVLTIMPHVPHEYIPYALCKALGIPTILQGGMAFLPGEKTNYILRPSVESYDANLNKRFKENLDFISRYSNRELEIPKNLERYIDHYDPELIYKKKNSVVFYNERNSLSDTIKKYIELIKKYLYRHDYSILLRKAIYLFRIRLESGILLRNFTKYEATPDLSSQFIFFALHLQPEATTLPLGGDFANQLLIIHMISSCLPEGVVLYVKEHPAYWKNKGRIESIKESRNEDFYRSIVSLPNVKLIDHNISSDDLLKHCLGVVTVTGTVGFESIFRGKPVLVFGSTYYEYYPGVFRIKTNKDCKDALTKICRKYNSTYKRTEMRAYLHALAKYVVSMGMNEKSFLDNGVPPVEEEDCKNLVNKIVEFYQEYYS